MTSYISLWRPTSSSSPPPPTKIPQRFQQFPPLLFIFWGCIPKQSRTICVFISRETPSRSSPKPSCLTLHPPAASPNPSHRSSSFAHYVIETHAPNSPNLRGCNSPPDAGRSRAASFCSGPGWLPSLRKKKATEVTT